jgi:hypothetical protein
VGLKKNGLLRWYPTDRQSREVELAIGLTACLGWDRRLRREAGLAAGGRGELGLRRAAEVIWLIKRGALQGRRREQRRDRQHQHYDLSHALHMSSLSDCWLVEFGAFSL